MSLVPVFKAENPTHAVIIVNMLQDAGIEAHLRSDDANGVMPFLDVAEGVDVLVDDAKAAEAEAMLEQFRLGAFALEEDGEG